MLGVLGSKKAEDPNKIISVDRNNKIQTSEPVEFTQDDYEEYYGKQKDPGNIDLIKEKHNNQYIYQVAALNPSDKTYRSVDSIKNNPLLTNSAKQNSTDENNKLIFQALDVFDGMYLKKGTVNLINSGSIVTDATRQRAISKLNVRAFVNAFEGARAGDITFIEGKGAGTLLVDPAVFYDTKVAMFASIFTPKNILESGHYKSEEIGQELNKLEGVPVSLIRKAGKKQAHYDSYITQYKKNTGQGIDKAYAQAQEAISFGNPATETGYLLMNAYDELGTASTLAMGMVNFVNDVKSFPEGLKKILGVAGPTEVSMDQWVSKGNENVTPVNMYDRLVGQVQANIDAGKYTEKNMKLITNMTSNLKKLLELNKGGSERDFKRGMRDLLSGKISSEAAKVARIKIAQISFVFQGAAALQGEGGKAISDGDRKVVQEGSSMGLLTAASTGKEAIGQFIRIIAKANAVNKALVDAVNRQDVSLLHAALNYSSANRGVSGTTLNVKQERQLVENATAAGYIKPSVPFVEQNKTNTENDKNTTQAKVFQIGSGAASIKQNMTPEEFDSKYNKNRLKPGQREAVIEYLTKGNQ